jgi:homogentisate 1,2-dioxygenase
MPIYHTLGRVPRKRHTAMRKPDGGIYSEQLVGHEGFTGTSALLYHVHPPTTVKSVRKLYDVVWEEADDDSLRHRHWRTARMHRGGSPTLDRTPMLFNADIAMLHAAPDREDEHFYRNAEADEVVYVAKGAACSSRSSASCRTARATTWSSTAASSTAGGSTPARSRSGW